MAPVVAPSRTTLKFVARPERPIIQAPARLRLLQKTASIENSVGVGIPNLYGFLRDVEGILEDPEVAKYSGSESR